MFSHSAQYPAAAGFPIDEPKLVIAADSINIEALLQKAGIDYNTVAVGCVTFSGRVFGSDLPLMIGVHFNSYRVKFVEIFRPKDYLQAEDYDAYASFAQLSGVLQSRYGTPTSGHPHREQWVADGYTVEHFITERFGVEEHLRILFN